ncbi:MAG: hypothetical protein JXD22_13740 [Sedimentisphaerales bacterium]|nr:hypothetical protein [Sedimentisphaerales bacterium]
MMRFNAIFLITVVMISAAAARADEPINIGSRLEPLVDNYLIENFDGATLTLQKPVAREVAIVHNEPWEGCVCCYHTVFQDGSVSKMYYRGSQSLGKGVETHRQVVCYAESRDGINWVKPDLGIIEFEGSTKNNIIWDGVGSHNFAPFKDNNPACNPQQKYKAMGSGKGGLFAFASPDAIHWEMMSEKPVITKGAFDSQNLAFWDSERGRYVDFHRDFRKGVRDILTCTSPDFLNWTEPVWLEYPGAPTEHLYTNQIAPYYRAPHIFLGFPKRYMPSRNPSNHWARGVSDGVFMTSRDGLNFHRWIEAIIRPGLQKERWVNRNNMAAWGILVTKSNIPDTPDELSIYATEGYYTGNDCRLRRYTFRIDGFVSVNAPLVGGEIVTKPLLFSGDNLNINYSTSAAGSIQVEIQDAQNQPIKGYTLDDCPEIIGDELEHVVTWENQSDLKSLAGKPVRLRFNLKDADLYSIRFR